MICFISFVLLQGFHNLTVNRITPTCNPQQDEKGDKEALCVEPFIQVIADGKTKQDRPRHGQTQLRDQGQVIDPLADPFAGPYKLTTVDIKALFSLAIKIRL
jgi:hypothetical protein